MKMTSKIPEWFARTRVGRAVLTEEERAQRLQAERTQAVTRLAELDAPGAAATRIAQAAMRDALAGPTHIALPVGVMEIA
jgi:hypothetical protein